MHIFNHILWTPIIMFYDDMSHEPDNNTITIPRLCNFMSHMQI